MATRKDSAHTLFDHMPKNFSYEENYHQKYYYPKLVLEKMKRRYAQAKPVDFVIDGSVCRSLSSSLSDSLPSLEKIASCSCDTNGSDENIHSRCADKDTLRKRSSLSTEHISQLDYVSKGIHLFLYEGESDGELCSGGSSEERNRLKEYCSSTSSLSSRGSSSVIDFSTDLDTEYTQNYIGKFDRKKSSSLKSLSGASHVRKKSVRFADALGLELKAVKIIVNKDQPPVLPNSALRDLRRGLEEAHKSEGTRHICLCFRQPEKQFDFFERVKRQKVVLEGVVAGAQDSTITGTVRVENICHRKEVVVRYTVNKWVTFDDIYASYVQHSNNTTTDRFSFTITLPRCMPVGGRLTFAIKYSAIDVGKVFWDNNYGENYHLECYAKSVPTRESDSAWMHFL